MHFLCIQSKHSEQNPDRKDHLEPEEKVWCNLISKYASIYFFKEHLDTLFLCYYKRFHATKIAEVITIYSRKLEFDIIVGSNLKVIVNTNGWKLKLQLQSQNQNTRLLPLYRVSRGKLQFGQFFLNPSHQQGWCQCPEPRKTAASSDPRAGRDGVCPLCCRGTLADAQTL